MTPDDFLNLGKQERIKETGMDEQQEQQPTVEELQAKYKASLRALKAQGEADTNLPPKSEEMKLPPQVKFGIAIMELEDGSVVRMPINPHGMSVTYGMMLRMLMGEIEDVRAEILAIKIKNLTRQQPPAGGGLVDLS
jgi:hypothetical protein